MLSNSSVQVTVRLLQIMLFLLAHDLIHEMKQSKAGRPSLGFQSLEQGSCRLVKDDNPPNIERNPDRVVPLFRSLGRGSPTRLRGLTQAARLKNELCHVVC
jgi:hypothetical protein